MIKGASTQNFWGVFGEQQETNDKSQSKTTVVLSTRCLGCSDLSPKRKKNVSAVCVWKDWCLTCWNACIGCPGTDPRKSPGTGCSLSPCRSPRQPRSLCSTVLALQWNQRLHCGKTKHKREVKTHRKTPEGESLLHPLATCRCNPS